KAVRNARRRRPHDTESDVEQVQLRQPRPNRFGGEQQRRDNQEPRQNDAAAPLRSAMRPTTTANIPERKLWIVNASDTSARLAWNSRTNEGKNTPNENATIGKAPRNSPSAAVATTTQP